jgi:hypothetical protein
MAPSHSSTKQHSTHALVPEQTPSDGKRITRSSAKATPVTGSNAATEHLKAPSPTAADSSSTSSDNQLSMETSLVPDTTTRATANSEDEDQASGMTRSSATKHPPRSWNIDRSTTAPLTNNHRSPPPIRELVETGSQRHTTYSNTRSNPFPPSKAAANQPPDSQLATSSPEPEKRSSDDDDYNDESSVTPPEKKTTRKPKAPVKKVEN